MKKGNKNLILFSMVFVLIIGIIYMWNINMGKTSTQVKETISFLEELSENVSVEAYENTEMLKISVTDQDPELAANIANSIAQVFSGEIAKIYQINNIALFLLCSYYHPFIFI